MKFDINKFGTACEDAREYYDRFETFESAWKACPRGDWMLWIAKRLDVDLRLMTKAKAECALTVRHLMQDKRSIDACEVALKFADGLATHEELRIAADAAAYAYAYAAADADAAAYAAAAAAYAAYASYASYADAAAAADADADAAAAARKNNQMATADICREVLTGAVFEAIKKITSSNK